MKRWLLALLLAGGAGLAHAALWGYVDGAGVAHFASRPLDSRYQLVIGDREVENTAARRVPGKASGAGRLLVWLEIAPEVKAVQQWLHDARNTFSYLQPISHR